MQDLSAPVPPPPLKRRFAFIAIASALAALLGLFVWALIAPHSVRLDCTSGVSDPMEFSIHSHRINGVYSLRFYSLSQQEVLWDVHLWTRPLERFTYGRLPDVSPGVEAEPITQRFPLRGATPRSVVPGEQFIVEIGYQYDELLAPSAGARQFLFEVGSDGLVKGRGELTKPLSIPQTDKEAAPAK